MDVCYSGLDVYDLVWIIVILVWMSGFGADFYDFAWDVYASAWIL